ncbi:MAG TPA: hypothetical protein VFZ48_05385 [Candidatus Saccharimonadales bacterium]
MNTNEKQALHYAKQLLHKKNSRIAQQLRTILSSTPQDFDIFVMLFSYYALLRYNETLLTGKDIAIILKRLVAAEQKVGGPYLDATATPDLGLNIIAGLILQEFTTLPKGLAHYLKKAQSADLKSAYLSNQQLHTLFGKIVTASPRDSPTRQQRSQCYQDMIKPIYTLVANAPSGLRPHLRVAMSSVVRADKNEEILLMPVLFCNSLHASLQQKVPSSSLRILCEANFLCWLAYTTYDALLDHDRSQTSLPVANWALRSSIAAYSGAAASYVSVSRIFDTVDSTNIWELNHASCRVTDGRITIGVLPQYTTRQKLAEKSLAHALGPLLIAESIGATQEQLRYLEIAFRHYLIARQLSDDLHDWRDDFTKGQMTSVVVDLLQGIAVSAGTYDVPVLGEQLKQYFWEVGALQQSKLVLSHCRSARRYFKKSDVMDMSGELFTLIDSLEGIAKGAIATTQRQKEFLTEYAPLKHAA